MRWKKLGHVFCSKDNYPWMKSHAANPIAEQVEGSCFKIYFNCRDELQRSAIGWVIIDLKSPQKILQISETPVLLPGEIGSFEDSGVSVGCIAKVQDKTYLYYMGWNLGVTVAWRNSIGLAVRDENSASFERFSRAPIIDRNEVDPFSLSYPWILHDKGKWRMWYGSNLSWGNEERDMGHLIKYAESDDGILWHRTGSIAINFKSESEYAIARPCVIKDGDTYHMWYSYRDETQSYRIGYAKSDDGTTWERCDNLVGIDVSTDGWDSEMVGYASVFRYQEILYMLYCGNNYGRTGFGLAQLENKL